MTTKDLILQELDRIPEDCLPQVLELIRQLKATQTKDSDPVWAAFQESLKENEEVYRRLADS